MLAKCLTHILMYTILTAAGHVGAWYQETPIAAELLGAQAADLLDVIDHKSTELFDSALATWA